MAKKAANKSQKNKAQPVAKAVRKTGNAPKKAKVAKAKRAAPAPSRLVAVSAKPAGKPRRSGIVAAPPSPGPKGRRPAAAPLKPITIEKTNGDGGPVESKLTNEEVEQFRLMLLEKRAQILGDVTTMHNEALNKNRQDAAGDLSSMPIHMADLGSDNYELEFTLSLIDGERQVLREIDEALERIRAGTFGICLGTGRPIGKARLKAKPWAKYSYEYALAQERGQGRRL